MSIDDKTLSYRELEFVLDEYGHWFLRSVHQLFYPASQPKQADPPGSFAVWLSKPGNKRAIEAKQLAEIVNINQNLLGNAQNLLASAQRSQKPPAEEEYKKLAGQYEQFTTLLKRVLRESGAGEEMSRDPVTGLYGMDKFLKDIAREADRVARQGSSFCMALVRIDHFEKILAAAGEKAGEECLKQVTTMILKCLRSFDDAYRHSEDMFILSLKQAGVPEGIKALHRLKDDVEDKKAIYGNVALTLSSCIAEPLPDEDFTLLMENMKKNMDAHSGSEGTILEYYELSPLQKMMKEGRP
ncbi:MAG: diguanylate cyclase [Alphaproteobacteria bacterium]|nr:diguanylate cyclase [Alphaproteobacteria bacterium]